MEETIYTEKDFYHLAKCIANRFYKAYYKDFNKLGMEAEDVIQEAYLSVADLPNTVKKFTGYSLPLVKKAVTWKLSQMVSNERVKNGGVELVSLDTMMADVYGNSSSLENVLASEEETRTPLTNAREMFELFFKFQKIKPLLTDNQYQIVELHLKDSMTFKEIGNKLNLRRGTVGRNYADAIKKLKAHYLE